MTKDVHEGRSRPGDDRVAEFAARGSKAEVWDRHAPTYDDDRERDPVYRCAVAELAHTIPERTPLCLDAACGTGLSTVAISARVRNVVALDFSTGSLQVLADRQLPNVELVRGDLTRLPFADGTFDAVSCANAIQHVGGVDRQRVAVRELQRVTRPGGVVAISVHHFSRDKRRRRWRKEGAQGHAGIADYIFRFSRADLASLVPGAAIRSVGFYGLGRIPYFGSRLQRHASRWSGNLAARMGYGHMLLAWTVCEGLARGPLV